MKKIEHINQQLDTLIEVFEYAGQCAQLICDIKGDIMSATRLYGTYGRLWDEGRERKRAEVERQSELLQKLTEIVQSFDYKVDVELGANMLASMLRAFRFHIGILEKIWSEVDPYHKGIISDGNMNKLRDLFEFDDSE